LKGPGRLPIHSITASGLRNRAASSSPGVGKEQPDVSTHAKLRISLSSAEFPGRRFCPREPEPLRNFPRGSPVASSSPPDWADTARSLPRINDFVSDAEHHDANGLSQQKLPLPKHSGRISFPSPLLATISGAACGVMLPPKDPMRRFASCSKGSLVCGRIARLRFEPLPFVRPRRPRRFHEHIFPHASSQPPPFVWFRRRNADRNVKACHAPCYFWYAFCSIENAWRFATVKKPDKSWRRNF